MTTVGQSIRSFNTDSVTGKAIEVQNYPIRKQPEDDAQRIKKIKLLRRVQLMVNAATKVRRDVVLNSFPSRKVLTMSL